MDQKAKKLYEEGYSKKEIGKILKISRYIVDKYLGKIKNKKTCLICSKEFEIKNNKQTTCSKQCRSEFKKEYLKKRGYEYEKLVTWRIKQKNKAVEYKGGKCVICKYDRCKSALEFHHIDPSEKDFNISSTKNRKFEDIINELDKCILVCANCHREIHDGLISV